MNFLELENHRKSTTKRAADVSFLERSHYHSIKIYELKNLAIYERFI
jgi:hypothetical protein